MIRKVFIAPFVFLIRLYQFTFSFFLGHHCRYLPTCSHYTIESLKLHGLWVGSWVSLSRLLRCGPWGGSGYDPVPLEFGKNAVWYKPWIYCNWKKIKDLKN
ncbi:MAG: putative membrane protein insertion efficiency factor [Alphaproteobacteria bacterium]|jgi:putative membrane protein insertion efficiency factor